MSEQIKQGMPEPEPIDLSQFSSEEQNAAAWMSVVLLLAENRAYCDAIRKVLIAKEIATEDEINEAIGAELTQPNLGNWYGFMNQLYTFRVAETLSIQQKRSNGEFAEEEGPKGDISDIGGEVPLPTSAPPLSTSVGINQTAPEETNERKD